MDRRAVPFVVVGALMTIGSLVAMRSRPAAESPRFLTPAEVLVRRPLRELGETVTGTVRSANRQPLAEARVQWLGARGDRLVTLAETRTDAEGQFSFPGARARRAGGCCLLASSPGGAPALVRRTEMGDGRGVTLTIEPGVTLDLPFVNVAGQAISGVRVRVVYRLPGVGGLELRNAAPMSDDRGLSRVPHLPRNATVEVRIDDPSYVQPAFLLRVATGNEDRKVMRPIVLAPATTVRGVVRDEAGRPIAGIRVVALYRESRERVPGHEAVTDARGAYRLVGLAPREYFLATEDRGASAAKGWTCSVAAVHVTSGSNLVAPDLRLVRGGIVTGRIRDAETGEPVAGLRVSLYRKAEPAASPAPGMAVGLGGGLGASDPDYHHYAPVSADGAFALCLPPGEWSFALEQVPNALLPAGTASPKEVRANLDRGTRRSLDFLWYRTEDAP